MSWTLSELFSWLRTAPGRRVLILTGSLSATILFYSVYSYGRSRGRRARATSSGQDANLQIQQRVGSSQAALPFRRQDSIRGRHRNSPSMTVIDGRQSSLAGGMGATDYSFTAGVENLTAAMRQWESVRVDSAAGQQVKEQLAGLLSKAQALQEQAVALGTLLNADRDVAGCSSNQLGAVEGYTTVNVPGSIRRGTLSILSDDSFQSALDMMVPSFDDCDITLREPLGLSVQQLDLYQQGVQQVNDGAVQCRVLRTEFVNCASDDEFLAKLYCVRRALETILADEQKRLAMCQAGRRMIAGLMRHANKDPEAFYTNYDAMMAYLREPGVWDSIVVELTPRRVGAALVCELSFYDIVLDFVLMDAFDDLAQPPSAVFAVTRSRYLSDSLKESTLRTIVWSVLKNKRSRLQQSNGFLSRFYDISETVSPVLAWGFLGTNQQLTDLCYYFKEQISNFVVDIFSFDRVRFTTLEELAEDIWLFCQTRAEYIEQRIDNELLPAEL